MIVWHDNFIVENISRLIKDGIWKNNTVRLLVLGHFNFYAVSKFLLRENDISVLLL